jgi:biopolymer transport protein ExbD
MHRRFALTAVTVLFASSLAVGCKSRGTITSEKPEKLAAPADMLPPIKSGATMTPTRFSIVVTKSALSVNDLVLAPLPPEGAWSHGFDAKYKRSGATDLYIVALGNAATDARQRSDAGQKTHEARLSVDPAIPYRILVEVMFTLGQSEFDGFALVAPSAGGRVPKGAPAEIMVHPPRARTAQIAMLRSQADALQMEMLKALGGDAAAVPSSHAMPTPSPMPSQMAMPTEKPTLGLTVLVVNDGISIKARGGNVAPGCNDVGAGIAIAKTADGHYDFAALTACVVKLKAAAPEFKDERDVTVTANPDVPFSTVLQTVDALRGDDADVFPDVAFGVAR